LEGRREEAMIDNESNGCLRVLVTGVGGGVGQSIIKSLQNTPYTVIGADAEALGTGLYAVAKAYKIPYASADGYVETLLRICRTERCSLIFPGLDAELPVLAREAHRFREIGVTPVISSPKVIEISDNKLATYQFLIENGFDAPLTLPLRPNVTEHMNFPVLLKPWRGGGRSKGVFVVFEDRELSFRLSTLNADNYVAKEYVESDEYTCGSITFDGRCYGTIVMRRVLRDGDTYQAFVEKDSSIHGYVKAVAEALKPFGACNLQLRLKDGRPYIFEINARCSGTTYSRTLAGFNEPLMVADYLLGAKRPTYEIREVTILRYWKELVVENSRITKLQEDGALTCDGSRL
jgi:carbamoyl-phosphate synthase large subunit